MRHLITLFDLTPDEILHIFDVARGLKEQLRQGQRPPLLPGRVMALLFDKQSLRTRVGFETLMAHLGGSSLFLGKDVGWGQRESIADFAQVLSAYVDVIVCRTNGHDRIEELAAHSTCPVVNGLTDYSHPCQALTDLFTIAEVRGSLDGARLAYVGDSNNVARSLAIACCKLGLEFAIASPEGYQFADQFRALLKAEFPDGKVQETTDPNEAVQNADAVYTDVWTSMGQESERTERLRAFADYQVNQALMSRAHKDACFLHCLPAHRGEEVSADVIDGRQSVALQQAANRMHVQKGLVAWLLDAAV